MTIPAQPSMFNTDPLDPEGAKLADRYLDLVKQFKKAKELKDVQGRNLAGLMRATNRREIRHGGVTIRFKETPARETLEIIEPKPKKKLKQ